MMENAVVNVEAVDILYRVIEKVKRTPKPMQLLNLYRIRPKVSKCNRHQKDRIILTIQTSTKDQVMPAANLRDF